MKILSSSPYAAFNPEEWNSISKANRRFSSTPIKIKKKFISTFKTVKSIKVAKENNDLPKQMQIAFT